MVGTVAVLSFNMLTMKKYVLIAVASVAMMYAACSTHYYGVNNSKSNRQAASTTNSIDTAMGGDAMKKDSAIH